MRCAICDPTIGDPDVVDPLCDAHGDVVVIDLGGGYRREVAREVWNADAELATAVRRSMRSAMSVLSDEIDEGASAVLTPAPALSRDTFEAALDRVRHEVPKLHVHVVHPDATGWTRCADCLLTVFVDPEARP